MSTVDDAMAAFLQRADDEGLIEVAIAPLDTPVGPMLIAGTADGLVKLELHAHDGFAEEMAAAVSPRVIEHPAKLDAIRRQLDEYFAGKRTVFDLPIDWRLSHGFRLVALRKLFADVGYGHTVSYKQLAAMSGNERASRAVGSAMATNPVPIVVPCHRVLDSAGRLHGYGGGLPMKEALLRLEGALL
ncbi:MAG: methylated-DNA-[protein]-cysteine S-methyltransferase [Acidimicrobiaceae bacterium]